MKKILNYFLKGLLIFAPMALTVFALVYVFTGLDKIFRELFKIKIPGLGLLVTVIGITFIGFLASNFLGSKFFRLIEKVFTKVPLVKMLYSALKDLIGAFAGEKKGFDKPVVVELIPSGPKAVGFITKESLEFLGMADQVSVYFPQSYNFAGSLLIFPAERVKPLDIHSSEAMTFILSGGVAGE